VKHYSNDPGQRSWLTNGLTHTSAYWRTRCRTCPRIRNRRKSPPGSRA